MEFNTWLDSGLNVTSCQEAESRSKITRNKLYHILTLGQCKTWSFSS